MAYKYFSRNGHILPAAKANIPLDDLPYAYGYGVYESVRVSKGQVYFLPEHCQRLMESARIIGLAHPFSPKFVAESAEALAAENQVESCNLKVLLIGGNTAETASLNILCLNPLFPDRKLYKTGVATITTNLERLFPHAKTLNMLPSYLAYRDARAAGAYDALLVNNEGNITEGTGTNFFALKDRTIFSPPSTDILLGVTRAHVLNVAGQNGFTVQEQNLKPVDLEQYDGLFLTSTSSKIMPISKVDDTYSKDQPVAELQRLMQIFDNYLSDYASTE